MNGRDYQTKEVTAAKREMFYTDGEYCESVNGRGNSNPFQVMQQAGPSVPFWLLKGVFSLFFVEII